MLSELLLISLIMSDLGYITCQELLRICVTSPRSARFIESDYFSTNRAEFDGFFSGFCAKLLEIRGSMAWTIRSLSHKQVVKPPETLITIELSGTKDI
jgi:hypothetical protein